MDPKTRLPRYKQIQLLSMDEPGELGCGFCPRRSKTCSLQCYPDEFTNLGFKTEAETFAQVRRCCWPLCRLLAVPWNLTAFL